MKAIVTFHSIDDSGSVLSFPPRRFRELVEGLARGALPVVDLDTLLRPSTAAGISLTFDDGLESVVTDAMPVLRDCSMPAHLFVPTQHVGKSNRWPGQPGSAPFFPLMSWAALERCHEGGMHIESHSATHADLTTVSVEAAAADCAEADADIERRVGRRPRYFAYPYGYFSAGLAARLSGHYAGCVTTQLRYLTPHDNSTALPRLDSYYLQGTWTDDLASLRVRGYLRVRSWMRTLRGSQ